MHIIVPLRCFNIKIFKRNLVGLGRKIIATSTTKQSSDVTELYLESESLALASMVKLKASGIPNNLKTGVLIKSYLYLLYR